MPGTEDFSYLLAAREINACFDKVDLYQARAMEASAADQGKADEFYVRAGLQLLKERERFPALSSSPNANRPGWYAWCKKNIKREISAVKICCRIAESPDPMAALLAFRANKRTLE